MTLSVITQGDWSGGIFRETEPQSAPANTAYDIVDGLLDDTISVYRRGGTTYKSNANTGTLRGLSDVAMGGSNITFMWTDDSLYRLQAADDATPTLLGGSILPKRFARPTVLGGLFYLPTSDGANTITTDGITISSGSIPAASLVEYLTAVGTPGRLVITYRNKAYFTGNGTTTFDPTDFHELPGGAQIIGCEGLGDRLVLFTTLGVFVVSNMNYDLTDDFGNVQQSVGHIDPNLILWGDPGVAEWRGALIVPAIDDVMLFSPGTASKVLSESIRPLYRSYVAAGYQPGTASVHRGHYLLPIVNGTTWVDTLVCRLDRTAWTRWTGGHVAFSQRVGVNVRSPKLFAAASQRVLDASTTFTPAAAVKTDADGTAHSLSVVTRDFSVRAQSKALWRYARLRYELTDAGSDNPTITAEKATGPAGSSFTSLALSADEDDGTDPFEWTVDERAQAVRLRFRTVGPPADCRFRSLEIHVRAGAKR